MKRRFSTRSTGALGIAAALAPLLGCRGLPEGPGAADAPRSAASPAVAASLEVAIAGPNVATAPTVVMLHGWGGDADDALAFVARAGLGDSVRVIAPRGPEPGPGGGRAWWQLDVRAFEAARARGDLDAIAAHVPESLAVSRERVVALLRALAAAPGAVPPVLGGFSQGAMLAADVAVHSDVPLAGLVLLSGMPVAAGDWETSAPRRRGLGVIIAHGRQDPTVPFAGGERLRDLLAAAGMQVTWRPFAGGHRVAVEALAEAAVWLRGP